MLSAPPAPTAGPDSPPRPLSSLLSPRRRVPSPRQPCGPGPLCVAQCSCPPRPFPVIPSSLQTNGAFPGAAVLGTCQADSGARFLPPEVNGRQSVRLGQGFRAADHGICSSSARRLLLPSLFSEASAVRSGRGRCCPGQRLLRCAAGNLGASFCSSSASPVVAAKLRRQRQRSSTVRWGPACPTGAAQAPPRVGRGGQPVWGPALDAPQDSAGGLLGPAALRRQAVLPADGAAGPPWPPSRLGPWARPGGLQHPPSSVPATGLGPCHQPFSLWPLELPRPSPVSIAVPFPTRPQRPESPPETQKLLYTLPSPFMPGPHPPQRF